MNKNQHAQLQSRSSAIADRVTASMSAVLPRLLSAAQQALAPLGVERIQAELTSVPANTMDGTASFLLRASTAQGELEWAMPVSFEHGVPVLTEQRIREEFQKAATVKAKQVVDMGETDSPTMTIDFKKVVAGRAGELVVYSSPDELPRWNHPVSASMLKTEEGRAEVLADLKQSINFYVMADFNCSANLVGSMKLPIVAAQNVKAAAQPKMLPELMADVPEPLQQPGFMSGVRTLTPSSSFSPKELRASEYRYAFEAKVRKVVEPVLKAWAQAQGGGAIEVIAWNLTEASDSGIGAAKGKVVATLRYYTDTSREEVEVQAAFNASGDIDAKTIAKTEQQVKFEAESVSALNLKNEDEAKAELAKFTAQQESQAQVEAYIQANLGLEASGENVANGQNFLNTPVVARIPILKALLPKEAASVGKELELNGYVYVLAETDYNNISGDPDHSAYLVAVLTQKAPNGKRPTMGLFGSLGAALAGR